MRVLRDLARQFEPFKNVLLRASKGFLLLNGEGGNACRAVPRQRLPARPAVVPKPNMKATGEAISVVSPPCFACKHLYFAKESDRWQ